VTVVVDAGLEVEQVVPSVLAQVSSPLSVSHP
jgi:hypothetical protein